MATKRLIDPERYETILQRFEEHLTAAGKLEAAETVRSLIKGLKIAPTVDAVEVSDYNSIEDKLECLLCHATGGKFSKASYSFADMERMVTDYIEECCEEAVAEEVVHGRWVPTYHTYYNREGASQIADEWHCSECGIYSRSEWNYCPNCGADMRERKDNG